MNEHILALLLGIIEGITEFLPISSTAHLRIAQHFLGVSLEDEFWKLFAVFIQLGAIAAVVVYYRKKIISLSLDFLTKRNNLSELLHHPLSLVLAAFITTAIPAFILRKLIGSNLENIWIMIGAMFFGGVIMWAVDSLCKTPRINTLEKIRIPQALWIGFIQISSAIFPGTSRSMSTIAAGQIAGLSRSAALEFSFFLSIPTMLVACSYDLLKYVLELKKTGMGIQITGKQVAILANGTIVSFIVAWFVIAWFLTWVGKRGFLPFAIYRILLAGVLFLLFTNT